MKASLNKSVRDAQIRDSFNKESYLHVNEDTMYNCIAQLYKVQGELPRNVSKLHTVMVQCNTSDEIYLLNFEVLRSIKIGSNKMSGFDNPDKQFKRIKTVKSDDELITEEVQSKEEEVGKEDSDYDN